MNKERNEDEFKRKAEEIQRENVSIIYYLMSIPIYFLFLNPIIKIPSSIMTNKDIGSEIDQMLSTIQNVDSFKKIYDGFAMGFINALGRLNIDNYFRFSETYETSLDRLKKINKVLNITFEMIVMFSNNIRKSKKIVITDEVIKDNLGVVFLSMTTEMKILGLNEKLTEELLNDIDSPEIK